MSEHDDKSIWTIDESAVNSQLRKMYIEQKQKREEEKQLERKNEKQCRCVIM